MDLDLKDYRLEHVTEKDDMLSEIAHRVINSKPELFWMLRHIKDSKKNIILSQLTEHEKERVYSYFMLTWKKLEIEMIKVLDGNVEYIDKCEYSIYNLKTIISDMIDVLSGHELWEECPNCENMTKFMKTGYCIDCNEIIVDRPAIFPCGDSECSTGMNASQGCDDCPRNTYGKILATDEFDKLRDTVNGVKLTDDDDVKVCPECKAKGGTEHRKGCSLICKKYIEPIVLTEEEEVELDDMVDREIEAKAIEKLEQDEKDSE